jgi:hypothetical protein
MILAKNRLLAARERFIVLSQLAGLDCLSTAGGPFENGGQLIVARLRNEG